MRLGPSVTCPSTKAEFHPASFWMILIFKIFKPPPLFSVSTCYCNLIIKGKKIRGCDSERKPLPGAASKGEDLLQNRCGHLPSLVGTPHTALPPPQLTQHGPARSPHGQDSSSKVQMDSLSSSTLSTLSFFEIFITRDNARGRETQLGLWVQVQVSFWLFQKSYFDLKPV